MTKQLYYTDSHLHSFTARVLACEPVQAGYAVVLDQTAFFPEGGGQKADTGTLGTTHVWDVQTENGRIVHYTDAPLEAGSAVSGELDWPQRFARMQSHSGEHVVSGIVHRLYGFENVGFHMGADGMTVDFSGELTECQLEDLERRANEAVWQNREIRCFFPDPAALSRIEYRSKRELTENVRLVEIDGLDRCACCAPHVSRTGEIGLIKITGSQRLRGGIRLQLLCGAAAYSDALQKYSNTTQISNLLSARPNETAEAVRHLAEELARCRAGAVQEQAELIRLATEKLPPTGGNLCFFAGLGTEAMRSLVNSAVSLCGGVCGAFAPAGDGYRYIITSRTVDLRRESAVIHAALQGRGGGKAEMIQGAVHASREEIEAFFEAHRFVQ